MFQTPPSNRRRFREALAAQEHRGCVPLVEQSSRRRFLKGLAALGGAAAAANFTPGLGWNAALAAEARKLKIGSCMITFEECRDAGLDGAEIRAGEPADELDIASPVYRDRYKKLMAESGLVIPSVMMALFNKCPLFSDPRAPAWLEQTIDGAKDLGAKVILVGLFYEGDLQQADGKLDEAKTKIVVERLKAAAPRAKDAGVILAVEDYLTAEQNLELLDRIGHESVQVYYDTGNSSHKGYDVPREIRVLKDHIVQIHFKDQWKKDLGQGPLSFEPIRDAINEIGYQGWIILEMGNPTKKPVEDARRNADFIRKLFGMPTA